MSFIYKKVNTKSGLFLFVILPIFYIIGSEILGSLLEKEEKRREKMKQSKEKNTQDEKENATVDKIDEEKNTKKINKKTIKELKNK